MMSWKCIVLPGPGLGRMIIFCNMANLYILIYIYDMNEVSDCGLCYAHFSHHGL
jgi:hypothetical protein